MSCFVIKQRLPWLRPTPPPPIHALQTPTNEGDFPGDLDSQAETSVCVSGEVVLLLEHFDIIILVPMSFLRLWHYISSLRPASSYLHGCEPN